MRCIKDRVCQQAFTESRVSRLKGRMYRERQKVPSFERCEVVTRDSTERSLNLPPRRVHSATHEYYVLDWDAACPEGLVVGIRLDSVTRARWSGLPIREMLPFSLILCMQAV